MKGARGSEKRRHTLRWAATGAAAAVAAALSALVLAEVPPFGADDPGPRVRSPHTPAAPLSPADALQPPIVTRKEWGADPRLLDQKPRYADAVHAVVIHHTGDSHDYDCSDSPHLVREMYATHAVGNDWGDLGYNFLVDRCGTIFEGRLGGVERPVVGAHALGLNRGTTGIAAIGAYPEGVPVPKPLRKSLEMLIAWKLGLTGVAPGARAQLVSTSSLGRFPEDSTVNVPTVLGHIDAYETTCPGESLLRLLPALRKEAARLQSKAKVLVKGDSGRPGGREAQDRGPVGADPEAPRTGR
ncbi:peptidoglycan recognition protein [Streptomyces sp. WMMC500]|uniref:peptidoglycan recognition protein family protein n=1 Tax=Streptomyces sp. WMMC500 TaxID=3015154 RepID=UPI00248AFFE5|nr:peptidoglycan recognition protein [Streptomyces sp. WMMC500]WBB61794.1 peptidoglycan recognition protein [Streptomyces sp. WMMC500]